MKTSDNLLWDIEIQTHHLILAGRPDFIIVNNNNKKKKKRKKRELAELWTILSRLTTE